MIQDIEAKQLAASACLMVATGLIQAVGMVQMEEGIAQVHAWVIARTTQVRMFVVMSAMMIYLFALTLVEMSLWALFFRQIADYSSFSVALYNSALGFTTLDTADLPTRWEFLSAAESITGLLMFAWSTSAMWNAISWITASRRNFLRKKRGLPPLPGTGADG
jgi:hypothetical protein